MANGSKNHSPELSGEAPSKRFKMGNLQNSPPPPPSPSQSGFFLSSMKGKLKLESETDSNVCGICLAEDVQDGNSASRGCIDSCDHYFCFVCIMEWAKVESRCPLCKRRFSTILRPPKPPLFPCERIVRVPVRDQVYYHFGNASTGAVDPYSDVECTVCHSSADESFLLLCDLCDSASHTHCVGLGATVPEGDWFCHDCTLLRAEHTQSELDTESREPNNSRKVESSSKNITASDIVRDPESPARKAEISSASNLPHDTIGRDKKAKASNFEDSSRHKASDVQDSSRLRASNAQGSSRISARTMQQRRNVLDRIQALRDNWNSFRSGSLNFPSSNSNSTNETSKIASSSAKLHCTSSFHERSNSENDPLVPAGNRRTHEVDKAWKMMEMAKSMEHKCRRKTVQNQASKSPLYSKHLSRNDQQLNSVNFASSMQEKQSSDHTIVNNSSNHKIQILEKHSLSGFQNCSKGFAISCSPVCESKSALDTKSPLKYGFFSGNGRNLPKKTATIGVASASSKDCRESFSLSSLVGYSPAASNLPNSKLENPDSSSSKIELSKLKDKDAKEKTPTDLKKKGNDDAKSEIQSLVKLNLKLLAADKRLGVNLFKEMARTATHSILSACGLEHPKPGIFHFPSSVCLHAIDGLHIRKSTLMPNSCRECFYAFVKDVVSTIMLEKIQSAEMHHEVPL